jgi:hypothetical protein
MRQWTHAVDEGWLRSRSHHLTATDVVKLLPEYRRWKKKPVDFPEQFVGLWGEKQAVALGGEVDVMSYGPAARGHLFEPYAISEYNFNLLGPVELSHCDDQLFWRSSGETSIACSPDALDAHAGHRHLTGPEHPYDDINPEVIGEVKSYEAGHHMRMCVMDDKAAPERYQLAVAFVVFPGLEQGELIFYNPSAPVHMHVKSYRRSDLEDEIADVLGVWIVWDGVCSRMKEIEDKAPMLTWDEADIWKETCAEAGRFDIK